MANKIGTISENSLHAALKHQLAFPGDLLEEKVENFVVDLLRGDTIIEIQTNGFYKLKPKLHRLLEDYRIHVVYPLPSLKWIIRTDAEGNVTSKRKSPKKNTFLNVFQELVYIPTLVSHPNLVIEVFLIEQEDILSNDGKGSWRRKYWSLKDQKLVQIIGVKSFRYPDDYMSIFSQINSSPFRNVELAQAVGCTKQVAQKITYTLSRTGLLTSAGKMGKEKLYEIKSVQ